MKIVHISDLHFGMNHAHLIEAFCKDMEYINPAIIIISGDLTQRAKTYQFQLLQQFLKQLPGTILLVPGNHDIPLNAFRRFLYPFNKYQQFIGDLYPPTYHNNAIRIIGVNSANPFYLKNGKLSSQTLNRVKDFFSSSSSELNILFFHHNFDNIHKLHNPLENEEEFFEYLKSSNIHIVCTGHLHHAHIGLIEKNNQYSSLILHAGSLCCTRSKDGLNSYYVINQNNFNCEIEWRVFNETQFELQSISQIDFSIKHAKLNGVLIPKETTI